MRKNKYGRRGPGNRCGYDPDKPVIPKIPNNLPPLVYTLLTAYKERGMMVVKTALDFRFETRGERDEVMLALGITMLIAMCVVTKRIGRPSKARRGEFEGLTVDYHLAPMSGLSESRIERAFPAFKDLGWLYYHVDAIGRRCSAQPIDEDENGQRRGRAAIRQWTPIFFRDIGYTEDALKQAVAEYLQTQARNQAKQKDHTSPDANVAVPIDPIVDRLARILARERPPP